MDTEKNILYEKIEMLLTAVKTDQNNLRDDIVNINNTLLELSNRLDIIDLTPPPNVTPPPRLHEGPPPPNVTPPPQSSPPRLHEGPLNIIQPISSQQVTHQDISLKLDVQDNKKQIKILRDNILTNIVQLIKKQEDKIDNLDKIVSTLKKSIENDNKSIMKHNEKVLSEINQLKIEIAKINNVDRSSLHSSRYKLQE